MKMEKSLRERRSRDRLKLGSRSRGVPHELTPFLKLWSAHKKGPIIALLNTQQAAERVRCRQVQALEKLKHFQSRQCAEKVEMILLHELPEHIAERFLQIREQLKLYEDDNAEELLGQLLGILEKEEEHK